MANTFNLGNGSWAQKTEKLLAYNAENDNYKPLPFDFDRASTATRVNRDGLIETVGVDEPRIDFLNNTKGHLLLELSRTNLVTYSEDFSQSVWDTWQATKTLSNNINPKGTSGYYEISHTGSSTDNPNTRLRNVSLNGSYTLSAFIKINQSRYISLSIVDYDGDKARVYFDTINKTFTTVDNVGSPITNTSYSEFPNGWIRISLSVNLLNAVYNEVGIGIYNPSGSFPSASGEVISVFGGQLEDGSYATSYIPTSGSAVTRSAETCNGAGNSTVFNDSEGVLYAEIAALADDGTARTISINNTVSNRVFLQFRSASGQVNSGVVVGGSLQGSAMNYSTSQTLYTKLAIKYKENDFALWVNGIEIGTSVGNVFSSGTLNDLSFDSGDGAEDFYGKVKDLKVYNTALTDAELIALTS